MTTSLGSGLDEAAIEAVKHWTFIPAIKATSDAIKAWAVVTVDFKPPVMPAVPQPIQNGISVGPLYSQNRKKIFIDVMGGDLDGFIAAEIVKQKLPVVVVTDVKEADLVLAGTSVRTADAAWYIAKDKNEGNVRLLDVKARTMIWAGEGGDRSLWMSAFKRGGERKIAERIVRDMQKDVFPRNAGGAIHTP